jgi:DNA topoisomerase-1
MKNLVIVESPAKAKTIEKFLGKDYKVEASYGHVRDLPRGEFGIDIDKDFEPKYIIPKKAQKKVNALLKEMTKYDQIYLATDSDREGEAISWHLLKLSDLPKDKPKRIVFYEVTKEALQEAIKNPRAIDINLVDAQQARRILDRLVGYKLSPLLWKKIKSGLSAGRVQSVALRLIVEKEREIDAFVSQEYWLIKAIFLKNNQEFEASLYAINDKKIDKLFIKNKKQADKILDDLKESEYKVSKINRKELKRFPRPPFTTSSLQQESFTKFKYSAKKTMVVAQQLYEGVELGKEGRVGLITYMRTDSFHIASEAIDKIRNKIQSKFGNNYLSKDARIYKNKSKNTQEAHEAIRPTYIEREPEQIKDYLTMEQFKLYSLIWQKTLACQMKEAIFDNLICEISTKNYTFRASGIKVKFDGFLKVYSGFKTEERILPNLQINETLNLKNINSEQKFTEPPKRYTEGSLVKVLEENGVGRPSTYAPTISTIQERRYVVKENQYLKPEEIGFIVSDILTQNFPEIIDISFTADLEKKLDEIAQGKLKWKPIIREFYNPFADNLEKKYDEIPKIKLPEKKTDQICEKCGSPMIIKEGRFGEFLACSGFPKCKNTKPIVKETGILCPDCGGKIIERKTKRGRVFYGCTGYPACKFASWYRPVKEPCPKCKSLLVQRGKNLICTKCDYKEINKPD